MSHFIVIPVLDADGWLSDENVYLLDTDDQVAEARIALRDAGLESAEVWSGELPDGESIKTWMIILAAS